MASRFIPLPGEGSSFKPVKSRQVQPPGILRGNRIDAHAEQRMRQGLNQFHDFVAHADRSGQIFRIAHAGQARFLFVGTEAGKIVFLFAQQALKILLGF